MSPTYRSPAAGRRGSRRRAARAGRAAGTGTAAGTWRGAAGLGWAGPGRRLYGPAPSPRPRAAEGRRRSGGGGPGGGHGGGFGGGGVVLGAVVWKGLSQGLGGLALRSGLGREVCLLGKELGTEEVLLYRSS